MSIPTILLIALALAMDAFAVSVTSGCTIRKLRLHHSFRIAAFFGVFQAIMPVAGWCAGRLAAGYIRAFDHWIAFGLLSFIGGKMIHESFVLKKEEQDRVNPLEVSVLFALAVATSIDAAAVGVSLSLLDVNIMEPAVIIGMVTFVISFAGTWIGRKCGDFFGDKMEVAGGVVLIGIGCKILIEHIFLR